MLIASGAVGAEILNHRGGQRLLRLDGWIAFIQYVRRMVECYALSESDILARVPREMLLVCGHEREDLPCSFRTMLFESSAKAPGEEAMQALVRFVNAYGQGYRTEQTVICDECLLVLKGERERYSDYLHHEKKRNTTVALSAAMGIAILLL